VRRVSRGDRLVKRCQRQVHQGWRLTVIPRIADLSSIERTKPGQSLKDHNGMCHGGIVINEGGFEAAGPRRYLEYESCNAQANSDADGGELTSRTEAGVSV
jgi:hypothetical protein